MADDARLLQLLEQIMDAQRTPEEVCRNCPELLPEVKQRLAQVRGVVAKVESLFPAGTHLPALAQDSGAYEDKSGSVETRPGAAAGTPRQSYPFLAPPQQPDEIGRLGVYRILEVLGKGGMGVVFKAQDSQLERHVAIKAMLPSSAEDEGARKRFLREAKTAAAIKHDNIVSIFQVGEERGTPFIAMELLDGEALDACLKREGKLPVVEAMRIGREIAEGLAVAHRRGLIHRDIKPANIWLERREEGRGARGEQMADCTAPVPRPAALSPRVKILDFGLVRVASEQVQITQSGAILGTPAFMAPEQAAGETVDARADLFSLGATLYRMVTGEQAFKGANTLAILSGLANVTPPEPRSMDSRVPPRLNDLIMRLLAKKPEERPQNAREIIDTLALLRLERDSDTTTSIVTPTPVATAGTNAARRRWALWAATAGGIIAFVVLAIAFFSGGTGNRQGEPQPDKGTGSVNEPDRGLDALKPGQDRKVAELVLKRGGMVRIDRGRGLSGDQPLPEEPFQLTSVLSTGISDDDLAQFAGLTSLEYLDLGGLSEVSNAGLGNLRDLPKLRVLIMTGSRVYDSGLKHLTSLPALEELSLGNREGAREKARITGAGLAPLRQLPDLRKLTLARVPLGEEGSGHIAALARLETLSLLECDIGVPEARKIARLRQLRVLGIIKTLLSGDAMAALAPLTSLTELNLQATQLGDSDLVHLKGMTKLQSLILTDNAGVTDAGLKHVEFLKALRSARLRGTKVTADGVAALHEAVPDCDIESEWNN